MEAEAIASVSSVLGEVAKAAPPLAVAGATFLGFDLQEWVYITTITYTVLQAAALIYDKVRRRK